MKNSVVYIDNTQEQTNLYYQINLHLDYAFPKALKDIANTN